MSAAKRHAAIQYQTLDELRAGLKEDEAGYTEIEIDEIVEEIGRQAGTEAAKATPEADIAKSSPVDMSAAELAEFKAWKAGKAAPVAIKKSPMQDFDVYKGTVVKIKKKNPFNEEKPHIIKTHILLSEKHQDFPARIEPHLARYFNEFAIDQEPALNHGEVSTAKFYFPAGKYRNGDKVPYLDFAAFQSEDPSYKGNYNQEENISLLYATGRAAALIV